VYTGVYLTVAFCTCTNGLTFGLAGGVSVSLRVSGWAFARRGMALTGSVVWCDVLAAKRRDYGMLCLRRSRSRCSVMCLRRGGDAMFHSRRKPQAHITSTIFPSLCIDSSHQFLVKRVARFKIQTGHYKSGIRSSELVIGMAAVSVRIIYVCMYVCMYGWMDGYLVPWYACALDAGGRG
jgi:hypothetical protein